MDIEPGPIFDIELSSIGISKPDTFSVETALGSNLYFEHIHVSCTTGSKYRLETR